MIICSFKKCAISMSIDSSENAEINIVGLEDCAVGDSEDEVRDDDADLFETWTKYNMPYYSLQCTAVLLTSIYYAVLLTSMKHSL